MKQINRQEIDLVAAHLHVHGQIPSYKSCMKHWYSDLMTKIPTWSIRSFLHLLFVLVCQMCRNKWHPVSTSSWLHSFTESLHINEHAQTYKILSQVKQCGREFLPLLTNTRLFLWQPDPVSDTQRDKVTGSMSSFQKVGKGIVGKVGRC